MWLEPLGHLVALIDVINQAGLKSYQDLLSLPADPEGGMRARRVDLYLFVS